MRTCRSISKMLIVIIFAFHFVYAYASEYEVPKPHFKLLEPQGFRVSIPHEEGVQLFAFHGNINKPMDGLEAGEFSKDILRTKKGRWVFEDRQTKLNKGDVIYYWLFIIKNHLGYRRDNGEYIVGEIEDIPSNNDLGDLNDITSTSPEGPQEANFHASLAHSSTQFRPNNDPEYKIALKVSDIAGDLYEEVKKLREINSVLKELAGRDENVAKTLKFAGIVPSFEDPEYAAQVIINEKLRLNVPVINATWNQDKSITFEVASLDDKIYVIRTAKKNLVDSKIRLVY